MPRPITTPRLAAAALCLALAGCGTAEPVKYSGIASSAQLERNAQDKSGRMPYRYASNADWRQYQKIIIDPVAIYQGPDQQFGTMTDADKVALAGYMQAQFTEKLRGRFLMVSAPGPHTLRLKLTLTGATATTPVLATLSRFDVAGGVYNGLQTARGGEGTLTGAVIYAVEIHDAKTNQLLAAYVSKQYPNPYDIPASFGPLAASKVGIDKGAEALLAELQ